jgi:hypothetical protein
VQTSWHSVREPILSVSFYLSVTYFIDLSQVGTCAMKPREQGGVVDARLNVYGVQNLKIAGNYFTILLEVFLKNYLILSVQTVVSHPVT